MDENGTSDASGLDAGPPPVPCPKCGERQNVSNAAFDPDDPRFAVYCMACGHAFTPVEFKMGLAAVLNEPPRGLARDTAERLKRGTGPSGDD